MPIFVPSVLSFSDYYPFGMLMPGRHAESSFYRYGFNGKENDKEIKGNGNSINFGARMYDSRIGRWLKLDNKPKTFQSNYNFALCNPIIYVDKDGNDDYYFDLVSGTYQVLRNGKKNNYYAVTKYQKIFSLDKHNNLVVWYVPGPYKKYSLNSDLIKSIKLKGGESVFHNAYWNATSKEQLKDIWDTYHSFDEGKVAEFMLGVLLLPSDLELALAIPAIAKGGVKMLARKAAVKEVAEEIPAIEKEVIESGSSTERTMFDELRTDKFGRKVPDPEAEGTRHTQLGTRNGRQGTYKQVREFNSNNQEVKDIDFTNHNRPDHTNPHQHKYSGKGIGNRKRGKAEPLDN